MALDPHRLVIEAAMNSGMKFSIAKRVVLYRGLAEICGDPAEGAKFLQLAEELELADSRCQQFAFGFGQQEDDEANGGPMADGHNGKDGGKV